MPLVQGFGDEVICAAVAAAATPLAIALSPSFVRKKPFTLLQRGAHIASRLLRVLWAQIRLWVLRRAQGVLQSLSGRRQALAVRGPSLPSGSVLSSSSSASQLSLAASPQRGADVFQEKEATLSSNFAVSEKHTTDADMRPFFGSTAERPAAMQVPQGEAVPEGVSPRGAPGSSDGIVSPPGGDFCSVCHDDFTLPCQANCGHWFCAECIMRVWHHSSALATCRCPICRRTITLLLLAEGTDQAAPPAPSPSSSLSSAGSSSASQGSSPAVLSPARKLELLRDVAKYNRLFGGVPVSFWQRLRDMPVLLRRLGRDLWDPARALSLLHNFRFVVCVLCAGAYVIFPLDLIPEGFLGVLGLLDDMVFLVCVAFYLTVLYRAVLLSRASAGPGAANHED